MKDEIFIKAPAKINLGLDIVGRRDDGYHELKMIMQTVSLYDELNISVREEGVSMEIEYFSSQTIKSNIPTDDRNLCIKAAKLMIEKFNLNCGFFIKLKKVIPSEAGLAGGSTDAAAVMIAIRDMMELDVNDDKLMELSVSLGADVPYCIMQHTALAEGIGEKLTRLSDMPRVPVVLVKPDVAVSTQEAYRAMDSRTYSHPKIDEIIRLLNEKEIKYIGTFLGNVFEDMVIETLPEINEIKQELREHGAFGELMSGSGSCCYGLFLDMDTANKCAKSFKEKYPNYQVFVAETI
ncbi:MAG: 4-(cytidine 5'-diphospho)-2-C-methyl-D-erythritol kinase [Lachnospiraceae bacterium]|nr:4-(cytidine 5'-diphospho)-2-C-methyl-D-erythritol kinase [Lachnospiraceae bacterium]